MTEKSIKIEPSWEDTNQIQVKYDERGNVIKEVIPGKEIIFKCEICERRFSFKVVLKRHMAEMHKDVIIITDSDNDDEIVEVQVEDKNLSKQTSEVLPQKRTRSESSSQEGKEIFNHENENKRQKIMPLNEENKSHKIVNTKKKCQICGENVQIIMKTQKTFGFEIVETDYCKKHADKRDSISCEFCKDVFYRGLEDHIYKWRYHMYSKHLKTKIHKAFGGLISSKCCTLEDCNFKSFSDSNQLIQHLIGKQHGILEQFIKFELYDREKASAVDGDGIGVDRSDSSLSGGSDSSSSGSESDCDLKGTDKGGSSRSETDDHVLPKGKHYLVIEFRALQVNIFFFEI